jgi:hypothetical protein
MPHDEVDLVSGNAHCEGSAGSRWPLMVVLTTGVDAKVQELSIALTPQVSYCSIHFIILALPRGI